MEIFAACPFAISTLAWEPAPGRRSLCVAIKATFTLVPGAVSTVAALQEPVAAEPRDGDGAAATGELIPFKPRADILLTGHAHAPRGTPTDTMLARARIGPFRKVLSITGDRTWVASGAGLRPSVAVPFRRMPLRYERAVRAGENLGGIDIIAQGAELGRPLPNIAAITDQGGETPGFGPLPLSWRAHRHGLGDAALMWASRVAMAPGPPPPGFDFRVFNAAPPEQQVEEIPPGVEIQLENLHPEHAWVETRLPAIRVKLFRQPPRGDRAAEMPVRCDTLMIDTDRGLASLIWRGAVLIEGSDDAAVGRLVIVVESEGERIGPEHADRLLAQLAPVVTYVEAGPALGLPPAAAGASGTLAGSARSPSSSSYPPPAPPPRPPTTPPARPATVADETRGQQGTLLPAALSATGLPFRAPPTGFEGMPLPARDSYPPPPVPAVLAQPPPHPAPTIVRPPSWGPHPDDGEATPPRGYPALGAMATLATMAALPPPRTPPPPAQMDRTATGTLLPPASVPPPRTANGTLRPPPASVPPTDLRPPSAPPVPRADEVTPATPLERTATGTFRPPPAALPFVAPPESLPPRSVTPIMLVAPAPVAEAPERPTPPPRMSVTPIMLVAPVAESGIGLAAYCAVKVDVWRTAAPIAEALARHGVDEAAFHAYERAQTEALAREAAEGRGDRAAQLYEALRAVREATGAGD